MRSVCAHNAPRCRINGMTAIIMLAGNIKAAQQRVAPYQNSFAA